MDKENKSGCSTPRTRSSSDTWMTKDGEVILPRIKDHCSACRRGRQPEARDASDHVTGLTIFVLAIFVGFEIITKVPPTLHTPLMSGSNAISGITLVGALDPRQAAWSNCRSSVRRSCWPFVAVALRHHQRRRRLPGHGPHARHVQEEVEAIDAHDPEPRQHLLRLAAVLFILDLKWMAHPTGRPVPRQRRSAAHRDGASRIDGPRCSVHGSYDSTYIAEPASGIGAAIGAVARRCGSR